MNNDAKRALRFLASQHYTLQMMLIEGDEERLEHQLKSISFWALDAIEELRSGVQP